MLIALAWALHAWLGPPADRLPPLFEPPARTYQYAPCVVADRGALHAWYCVNGTPGEITDCIGHRKARKVRGRWVWGPQDMALRPGAPRTAWDSRHVCDPEVVAGRFRFRRRTWRYAMLYLGCDAEGSTHNQVGVAVANTLDGPWVRYPDPVIRYTSGDATGPTGERFGWPVYRYWGVGQPAAVSLDRKGTLLVFYSRGEQVHGEMLVEMDLSDLDRGPIVSTPIPMPTRGLTDDQGRPLPAVVNVGVALDERRKVLYLVGDGALRSDGLLPDFISAEIVAASIPWVEVRAGAGVWQPIGWIGSSRTGWLRNHNASIVKDAWGRTAGVRTLDVALSVAEAYRTLPPESAWLWTYRIVWFDLPLD